MQFALILTIYGSENKNSALSGFQQLLFILTKRQKSRMSTDNTDFMVKGSNDKKCSWNHCRPVTSEIKFKMTTFYAEKSKKKEPSLRNLKMWFYI